MLVDQNGLKPIIHQLLAGPSKIGADIERRRDLAVAPSRQPPKRQPSTASMPQ
jgi:hypothetical protein